MIVLNRLSPNGPTATSTPCHAVFGAAFSAGEAAVAALPAALLNALPLVAFIPLGMARGVTNSGSRQPRIFAGDFQRWRHKFVPQIYERARRHKFGHESGMQTEGNRWKMTVSQIQTPQI